MKGHRNRRARRPRAQLARIDFRLRSPQDVFVRCLGVARTRDIPMHAGQPPSHTMIGRMRKARLDCALQFAPHHPGNAGHFKKSFAELSECYSSPDRVDQQKDSDCRKEQYEISCGTFLLHRRGHRAPAPTPQPRFRWMFVLEAMLARISLTASQRQVHQSETDAAEYHSK